MAREAARVVGDAHGLAEDWLNDAVKDCLPGPDADAQRYFSGAALNVDVASARYLLALKLFASRVETDADDIAFCHRQVGFTTVEEGLALVITTYRRRPIAPRPSSCSRRPWRPSRRQEHRPPEEPP